MSLAEHVLVAKKVLRAEVDVELPRHLFPTGLYVAELRDPGVGHFVAFSFEGRRYKIGHRIKKDANTK